MSPAPGGGFVVVVNGQNQGTYSTQTTAEQQFNTATGQSNTAAPTAGTYQPNGAAQTTADMLVGLDQAAGGYWSGNRNDPAAVAAAYHGAANPTATPGATLVPYNAAATNTQLQTLQANIQAAYNQALVKGANQDRALQAAYDAAQTGGNLIKTYGDQALQALQQATTAGLGVADMLAKLQGPSNAFAYDRAIQGVGANGLSNSINALTGDYRPPSFGAMGPTSPMTLQTMASQTQSPTTFTAPTTTTTAAVPGTYQTVNGIRTPDQMYQELKVAGWGGSSTDTAGILGAYAHTTLNPVTPAQGTTSTTAGTGPTQDLNSMVAGLQGQHMSITDKLLGLGGNAITQLAKVSSGQLPFSLPKFDAGGSGAVA